MKLKKAKEYLTENFFDILDPEFDFALVESIIKDVQLDTIDYTVKKCAENAESKTETYCSPNRDNWGHSVDKDSILNVAKKIKEELDEK